MDVFYTKTPGGGDTEMSRCLCSTALSGCLLVQFLLNEKLDFKPAIYSSENATNFHSFVFLIVPENASQSPWTRGFHTVTSRMSTATKGVCVSPGDVMRVTCSASQPLPPLLTVSPAVRCTDFARGMKTTSEYSHTRSPGLIT